MSSSYFVNFILKIYKKLDIYFENSFVFKILCKIGDLSRNSALVTFIIKLIAKKSDKKTKENSFVINNIYKVCSYINKIFTSIYVYLCKKSENSLLCSFSKQLILPLSLGKLLSYISFICIGFFSTRLIFMTLKYGVSLNIFLINGGLLLFTCLISLVDKETLNNMIEDSIITKLIKWFFVS